MLKMFYHLQEITGKFGVEKVTESFGKIYVSFYKVNFVQEQTQFLNGF